MGISAATHPSNGRASTDIPVSRLEFPYAFARTVVRYLLLILPSLRGELAQWRTRAGEIPNANLRRTASQALAKRGNVEGAALFATLVPAVHRARAVRALVAFQTAYNYLDALSELPSEDPVANGGQLHQALRIALQPGAAHADYYAHNPDRDDGGYLAAILDVCREAVAGLPSYDLLAHTVGESAARIVDFQALNLSEEYGGHDALERWARGALPAAGGLEWWETAAGAGSSLAVYALIAATVTTDPYLDAWDAHEIDRAYFPWIGALHTLLDSLVDRREDREAGRPCLLNCYRSPAEEATRLADLAIQARERIARLPSPHAHRAIMTAMCSYYLSAPECDTAEAKLITRALCRALGLQLSVAIAIFRARRLAATLTGNPYN
jgi:tetraprenyl-beta-curcumene synthase